MSEIHSPGSRRELEPKKQPHLLGLINQTTLVDTLVELAALGVGDALGDGLQHEDASQKLVRAHGYKQELLFLLLYKACNVG